MKERYVFTVIFTVLLVLQGCAGSASFHMVSLASVVVTGKSVSDHAMSAATKRDCSFFNLVQDENLCRYSGYSEISLLTNNQTIDESLLVVYQEERELFLVLASFSRLENARKYQIEHDQWQTKLYKSVDNYPPKFRVLMKVHSESTVESLKNSLTQVGINEAWKIRL